MNENKDLETVVANATPVVFSDEIVALIRSDLTPKKMRERIEDYHEKDIAMALADLTEEERKKLFRLLTMEILVSVLEYSEDIAEYFQPLTIRQKVEALSLMEVGTAVELLQQLIDLLQHRLPLIRQHGSNGVLAQHRGIHIQAGKLWIYVCNDGSLLLEDLLPGKGLELAVIYHLLQGRIWPDLQTDAPDT